MERLHIAEFQLQKLKLLSRDIRRALLIDFPDQLPGHRRFLDTLARALGYSSFSHLSIESKSQFESTADLRHAVYDRRVAIASAVLELLESHDENDKNRTVQAIESVLEKQGVPQRSAKHLNPFFGTDTHQKTNVSNPKTLMSDHSCVRIRRRRRAINEKVENGELGGRDIEVGLKAVRHICEKWALVEQDTSALIDGNPSSTLEAQAPTLERLSYILRIYRLLNDVQQGDADRAQNWIRRAMPVFGGRRPIDLMKQGPVGCAEVMEYLQHILGGGS